MSERLGWSRCIGKATATASSLGVTGPMSTPRSRPHRRGLPGAYDICQDSPRDPWCGSPSHLQIVETIDGGAIRPLACWGGRAAGHLVSPSQVGGRGSHRRREARDWEEHVERSAPEGETLPPMRGELN